MYQSSQCKFWTGIGPIPNSVRPGQDWTELVWTSPALCPGLGYISHRVGLLMGELYLDGTEYTDRTVIILPRICIQRWVVIQSEDESWFQWYLTIKQCRNCKRVWTGPDQARPVQDWQCAVQSSPTFRLDWTELSPTPDWVHLDWWNHWIFRKSRVFHGKLLADGKLWVCGSFGYLKALGLWKLWLVEGSKSVEALMLMLT